MSKKNVAAAPAVAKPTPLKSTSKGYHFVQKVIKGDTYLVMADPQYSIEDEFAGNYFTLNAATKIILQPPFDPKVLARLVVQNNVLSQCVDVMEVNIDGTGYEFVPTEDERYEPKPLIKPKPPVTPPKPLPTVTPDGDGKPSLDVTAPLANQDAQATHGHEQAQSMAADQFKQQMQEYDDAVAEQAKQAAYNADIDKLNGFFEEPYPGVSFTTIRRNLRRDLESIGYAFLEVLRNPKEDIVGLRNVVGHATRFVKLDKAVQVTKSVTRGGKEVELTLWERERRFAQRLWGANSDSFVYYREFNASRKLHRDLGLWEGDPGLPPGGIPADKQATELLLFGVIPDVDSSYFVPRWINQLPSVIGSRKAEEANLEFFDAGGLPPAIIFIEGGTLADDVADQIKAYMSGVIKNRSRAMVVEAQSTSGGMDSAGQVKVTVERFGAEKANDALYMGYDKSCADHVRGGFRFPPLFLGINNDANFATAMTSFMVAEAQVFAPERAEFDEMINKTIIKGLGVTSVKMKSKPITLKNIEVQLQGITLVESLIDKRSLVTEVNKLTGLSLEADEKALARADAMANMAPGAAGAPGGAADPNAPAALSDPAASQAGDPIHGLKVRAPSGLGPGAGLGSLTKMDAAGMFDLVQKYARICGLTPRLRSVSLATKEDVKAKVKLLKGEDKKTFYEMLGSMTMGNPAVGMLLHEHECV